MVGSTIFIRLGLAPMTSYDIIRSGFWHCLYKRPKQPMIQSNCIRLWRTKKNLIASKESCDPDDSSSPVSSRYFCTPSPRKSFKFLCIFLIFWKSDRKWHFFFKSKNHHFKKNDNQHFHASESRASFWIYIGNQQHSKLDRVGPVDNRPSTD